MATILSRRQIWSAPVRYVRVDYTLSSQSSSSVLVRFKVYYEMKTVSSQSGNGYKCYFRAKVNGSSMPVLTLKGTSPYQWSDPIIKYAPSASGYYTAALSEGQSSIPFVFTFSCDDPADETKTYSESLSITPIASTPQQPISVSALCDESSEYCHYGFNTTITAQVACSGLYHILSKSVDGGDYSYVDAKTEDGTTVNFAHLCPEKSGSVIKYSVASKQDSSSLTQSAPTESNSLTVSGVKIYTQGELKTATPYVGTANGIARVKKTVVKNASEAKFSK